MPKIQQIKDASNMVVCLRASWTDEDGIEHRMDFPPHATVQWTGSRFIDLGEK